MVRFIPSTVLYFQLCRFGQVNRLPNCAEALKDAIKYLTKPLNIKSLQRFAETHNFYLYFSYQLFDKIPLGEFNQIIEKDAKEILEKLDAWIAESKENELLRICETLDDLRDFHFR